MARNACPKSEQPMIEAWTSINFTSLGAARSWGSLFKLAGNSAVARCNSDACARLEQAQEALACLKRALEIVDGLDSSSVSGARIQHAIDTLICEMEIDTQRH